MNSRKTDENYWREEYGAVLELGFLDFNKFKSNKWIDASFLLVLSSTCFIVLMNFAVILHSDDLDLWVECGQRILIFSCSIIFTCNFAGKRSEFFEIVGMLRGGLSNYDDSEKAIDLHVKRRRDERSMVKKYNITFSVIFFGAVTAPLLDVLTGDRRKNTQEIYYNFPFALWSPVDLTSSWLVYCTVYLATSLAFAPPIANIACFQYVVVFICNRVSLEMELLIDSVVNLERRVVELNWSTKSESVRHARCIADNVKHYDRILRTYKRIRSFLNYSLIGPLVAGSLIVALGVLFAVTMDSTTRLGPKMINLLSSVYGLFYFHLIQSYFELIQDMNEKVRQAFYEIQWFAMPPTVGKSVLLTLTIAQQPLEFKCIKVFLVDSRIIGKIVQSAFSVINLMLALKTKN